jgi:hypothetical protein
MFRKIFLFVSMCNLINCSQKEDIILGEIKARKSISADSLSDGHHNHWGAERSYNEQHREHLPIVHAASTSIVTARLDRGVIDLPGVPRVTSDDSPDKVNVDVNIATTVQAKCCNSKCCDDDKVYDCCC